MLDPKQVPAVEAGEQLARFILVSCHIRKSDNTVKPEAFMPHPRIELSMTRHREATSEEIWNEGERVATIRQKTLYGRADVEASAFLEEDLSVIARPLDANANHADAIGWPADKSAQKMKAIQIASKSQYGPKES